jgi:hypothetical protein
MSQPKTAFEVFLEANPDHTTGNTNKPVVFFSPNTTQDSMRDFRAQQVSANGPDPEGYDKFTPGGSGPKGSSVMVSAPTSPESSEDAKELPVTAEKVQSPPSPVIAGPKSTTGKNAKT